MTARGRLRSAAAVMHLNRLTEVESATTTSSGAAPMSGATFAPTRRGRSIHPAETHARTSPRPQRVAVEIDDACGHLEGVAHRSQRIAPVELIDRRDVNAAHLHSSALR